MASWVGDEGEISLGISRPGRVKYFFEHSFVIDKKQYGHCFACVQWFKEYPNNSLFKNPLSVYYAKVFKLPGPTTFIPVQRIQSRFVAINRKVYQRWYCNRVSSSPEDLNLELRYSMLVVT